MSPVVDIACKSERDAAPCDHRFCTLKKMMIASPLLPNAENLRSTFPRQLLHMPGRESSQARLSHECMGILRVPFKKGSAKGHASHSLKRAMNGTTQQRLLLGMQSPKVHVRQQSQYPPPAGLVIDEQTLHRTNRSLHGSSTTWTQSCRRRDAILYCFSKYVSTDPNKREQRVFSSGRLRPACARADDAPPYAKGPTLHICTLMSTSCHRLTNPNVDCQKMNVSLSLLKINAELTHQTTITLRRPLR